MSSTKTRYQHLLCPEQHLPLSHPEMAWGLCSTKGPLLTIQFAEAGTNGYLFVRTLARGQDRVAVLIRSIDTGELAVRKFPLSNDADQLGIKRSKFLASNEVLFMQALRQTGIIPQYISVEGCRQNARSITMQYCNGGTVWDYFNSFLANGPRQQRETFLWLVLGECLRAFCFLFTGCAYAPPSVTVWTDRTPKGKFVPLLPESQPSPIFHTDAHMCNIFLAFDAEIDHPQVLLADFSRADYRHNFLWGPGVIPELVEVDVFMKSLLSLHPRPSLAIDRKVAEIRRQMNAGTTLLQLLQGGLYDECMQNFRKQDLKLPMPTAIPRGEMPKIFDLTPGSYGYISNLWNLREAIKVVSGSYEVLQIPQEDVCGGGKVSVARATILSRRELMKLTAYFDDSDASSEADCAESDNDVATSHLDGGAAAQGLAV